MISSRDDGIVVGEVEKGDGAMEPISVPAALRERLGQEATAGLLEFSQTTGRAWREDVLSVATDRFERRLTEDISGLRVEMANGFASLRQEMGEMRVQLRQEMVETRAQLRQEIAEGDAGLRQEMGEGHAQLRQEIYVGLAAARVDLIKWSFFFWIGQVLAIAGFLAILLERVAP